MKREEGNRRIHGTGQHPSPLYSSLSSVFICVHLWLTLLLGSPSYQAWSWRRPSYRAMPTAVARLRLRTPPSPLAVPPVRPLPIVPPPAPTPGRRRAVFPRQGAGWLPTQGDVPPWAFATRAHLETPGVRLMSDRVRVSPARRPHSAPRPP